MSSLLQSAPQVAAAFLGSSVEAVEAMTLVLAAGAVRGWRSALVGCAVGLLTLAAIVVVFGTALAAIPIALLQIVIGAALLLFGLRWLRKAMLRAAGVIALHDETAVYAQESAALRASPAAASPWDVVAMLTAYKAVVLEGVEVVVIVLGVGASGGMLVPASIGAIAACAVVALAGAMLHRPLARLPENALKHTVGIMLTAFGLFWFGEGIGIAWPYGDASLLLLAAFLLAASWLVVRSIRTLDAASAQAAP